jgi:hypothetical protein
MMINDLERASELSIIDDVMIYFYTSSESYFLSR